MQLGPASFLDTDGFVAKTQHWSFGELRTTWGLLRLQVLAASTGSIPACFWFHLKWVWGTIGPSGRAAVVTQDSCSGCGLSGCVSAGHEGFCVTCDLLGWQVREAPFNNLRVPGALAEHPTGTAGRGQRRQQRCNIRYSRETRELAQGKHHCRASLAVSGLQSSRGKIYPSVIAAVTAQSKQNLKPLKVKPLSIFSLLIKLKWMKELWNQLCLLLKTRCQPCL